MLYVKTVPRNETGIRRFCLWAIGLAVLTLQNIRKKPGYLNGDQVKVSRRAVSMTVLLSNVLSRSNRALSLIFRLASSGLSENKQVIKSRP